MVRRLILALSLWACIAAPAPAAAAREASPELRARAGQVVALLRGEAEPGEIFAPSFLAAVPAAQLEAVTRQLVAQHGPALSVASIEPRSATAAAVAIEMERALLRINLAIEPAEPHRILGLLVTGAEPRGDSLAAVVAELAALPGRVSFAAARLGDGAPQLVAGHRPDEALAIGSAFKLFILAELARQVEAGERRWSDVVALDRRSLPSGVLQDWPAGSPVTLHTLAALMISRSDNTATDILLRLVGRENVERTMAAVGVADPARNRPFLGTLEAFALKTAAEAEFGAWRSADEAGRRRLLAERFGAVEAGAIDPSVFAGPPVRIDSVEWFASSADLVRTMDWLRRQGGEGARGILAITPGFGTTAASAARHAYQGYKGGSEPGVINMTFLARDASGRWFAVAGSWNDPSAPVDNEAFAALMARALQQLR